MADLLGQCHGTSRVASFRTGQGGQQPGQLIPRIGIVGFDLQRLLPMAHGLGRSALEDQGPTQIVLRIAIIRFDSDRLLELWKSFRNVPSLREGKSQIVVGNPIILCDLQGVAKQRLRVFPIANLKTT